MSQWRVLGLIAGFGAVGAVARYLLSGWMHQLLGTAFPYGTLAVNVLGCFAIGVLSHLGDATTILSPDLRIAAGIGGLGAFTTFSTFGYETVKCLEDGAWWPAVFNVAANVVIGALAVWAGLIVARSIMGGA